MDTPVTVETPTPAAEPSMEDLLQSLSGPEEATAPKATEPVEPAKEEPKEPLGTKFTELARRERMHQQEVQKFKAESAGFKDYQIAKQNAERDPVSYVTAAGVDIEKFYDALTNHILDGKNPQNAKFRELEASLAKMKQEKEDEVRRSNQLSAQRAQEQARQSVKDGVVSAGDKFELVNIYGRYDLVCDEIVSHYNKTKQELSIEAAAEKVEALLEAEARKIEQSKKFRNILKSPSPTLVETSPTKTLTNSASNAMTQVPAEEMDSAQELAWAARMLKQ